MNTKLKIKTLGLGLALATSLAFTGRAIADQVDFSSITGADINFYGNSTFNFTPVTTSTTPNFEITDTSAAGLFGQLSGTFTIGAISGPLHNASANVSGTGAIEVFDGSNLFSGLVSWETISVTGQNGGLNYNGDLSLTDITYGGSNAELLALKNSPGGVDLGLSFTFTPAETLSTLKTHGSVNIGTPQRPVFVTDLKTGFSGQAFPTSPVPDGGTTALLIALGIAGIAVGILAQRRKTTVA